VLYDGAKTSGKADNMPSNVLVLTIAALAGMSTSAIAQETRKTRLGARTCASGSPSPETVATLYDAMDVQRACPAYLWGIPAVGIAAWKPANDHVCKVRNGQPSRRNR
jgi:hypothetical protein